MNAEFSNDFEGLRPGKARRPLSYDFSQVQEDGETFSVLDDLISGAHDAPLR
jgi:hypothetical protein